MKRINFLLVILTSTIILSCSDDDSKNITKSDILVGVWKPVKEVEVFTNNSIEESQFSICHQMSRFTFFDDGSLTILEFVNDEITKECEEKKEPVLTFGSWEKNLNNEYRLITTYTYTNNQESYTDDDIPDVFEFLSNNVLQIGYNDDEVINGKQLKHYYTEFIRVE